MDKETKLAEVRAIIEKSMAIYKAKAWAMEKYKVHEAFELEIIGNLALAFTMGFNLCKLQVARLFLKVDVSCLNPKESKDKAKENGAIVGIIS